MVLNGKVGVVDNTRHSAPGLGVRACALVILRRVWACGALALGRGATAFRHGPHVGLLWQMRGGGRMTSQERHQQP